MQQNHHRLAGLRCAAQDCDPQRFDFAHRMARLMDREMVRSRSRDKKGGGTTTVFPSHVVSDGISRDIAGVLGGGMRGWSDSDSDDGKYQLKAHCWLL